MWDSYKGGLIPNSPPGQGGINLRSTLALLLDRAPTVNFSAGTEPTIGDDLADGYYVGSKIYTTTGDIFECLDNTVGAAVWKRTTNSKLDANLNINNKRILNIGGVTVTFTTVSTATTLTNASFVVVCDSTSPFTLTLPAVASNSGLMYLICNANTGDVTVDGNGAETINGAANFVLSVQYSASMLLCTGSAWLNFLF